MSKPTPKWYSRGGIRFLFIVLLLYLLAYFINADKAVNAGQYSGQLLYQIFPILFLVFFFMFITHLLVKPSWVKTHLGTNSGLKGWLIASIGGVLSMGSIYPWLALLKDLKVKGMRTALITVFLYSRGVKIPLLPMLIHYFGLTYTVVLTIYTLLFSLLGGVVMEKLLGHEQK